MGVAHTLSRRLFWAESILWKEDLQEHNTTVFLGEKDSIINAPQVLAYLQSDAGKRQQNYGYASDQGELSKRYPALESQLSVIWCADLDHGQVFDLAPWTKRLQCEVISRARVGHQALGLIASEVE